MRRDDGHLLIARAVRASLAVLATLLASGCYASHSRTSDADVRDARASCTFSFRGREGAIRTCVIAREEAACADVARCVCTERLDAPTEAELQECIRTERIPRALVTLSDVCDRELALDAALDGYFHPDDLGHVDARCSEIPARFDP